MGTLGRKLIEGAQKMCIRDRIGTVNGVNFTDGLDGLASSVTVLVATFFTVVAIGTKSGIEPITCAVVAVSYTHLDVYKRQQFEYSDYRDGNNLYHDICSTSEDEDICRHSRCGNCSCDCRCKNSGNNDGNERKLPSAPYSCMAESGKICVGRWISDHAGIVCDRIWWLFW